MFLSGITRFIEPLSEPPSKMKWFSVTLIWVTGSIFIRCKTQAIKPPFLTLILIYVFCASDGVSVMCQDLIT